MLTARSVTLAGRSLAITRESQVGDRISHAIDHLASDKVAVRVGGVYSLERISLHAPTERSLIFEVLNTFVDERAAAATQSKSETKSEVPEGRDIAAALTVLDRWHSR
jgi:hypothetical protein